jgi:uncharacterized protein (DUF2141 family)
VGAISGTVFSDLNANGKLDNGEKGLAAVKVFIDTNKNGRLDTGETSVLTSATGTYSFPGLAAGTYRITEVLPTGFDAPATSSIAGRVFSDANGNGLRDIHETGLGLITVYLDLNNDGKFDTGDKSVVTDVLGNWSFTGLTAGTYAVRVVPITGLAFTKPTGGALSIKLAAAQASVGNLFGEFAIA